MHHDWKGCIPVQWPTAVKHLPATTSALKIQMKAIKLQPAALKECNFKRDKRKEMFYPFVLEEVNIGGSISII